MTTISIYDHLTGETIVRDLTAEEIADVEAGKAEAIAKEEAETAKATQRQAILDRLGLTAEEAALLLGGN